MLFIHTTLALGGIETFYVRMARVRARAGKRTCFLLLAPRARSAPALVEEARRYADVLFLEDFICLPRVFFRALPLHLLLMLPLRLRRLRQVLGALETVHVGAALPGIFYARLLAPLGLEAPLTVGVYHSREFIWQRHGRLPYYERCNRRFVFQQLSDRNLVFFNDRLPQMYRDTLRLPLEGVSVFPLGVVDRPMQVRPYRLRATAELGIVSVGRLVEFKTYNLWMLDVVRDLKRRGLNVRYTVYGDGPLAITMRQKIAQFGLEREVELRGPLEYARFAEEISRFDAFVGSGSALIEAASLGVPSIVGIERVEQPLSYGFLSDLVGFTYNEDGLYSKVPVADLLVRLTQMSGDELQALEAAHLKKARLFSMEACAANFDKIHPPRLDPRVYRSNLGLMFALRYSMSFFLFSLMCRLRGSSLSKVVYG